MKLETVLPDNFKLFQKIENFSWNIGPSYPKLNLQILLNLEANL